MPKQLSRVTHLAVATILVAACTFAARAQTAPTTAVAPPRPAADQPAPRRVADGTIEPRFQKLHGEFLERAKSGPIGLLFLGDSITEGWRRNVPLWDKTFGKHQPANFGISGDTTQGQLWRLDNGELDGIDPKVVTIMIGTNNMATYSADEIISGNKAIVGRVQAKLPRAKILLLAIFPRGERFLPDGTPRDKPETLERIRVVNAGLAKLADGDRVRFLDLTAKFAPDGGFVPKTIMADGVHLTPAGYQIWADAVGPVLDELMAR